MQNPPVKTVIPSLGRLQAFEAAARHLSFTRAAVELCVTQGAVSYHIRELEHELGAPLFIRRHRQVALTDSGQRLFLTLSRALRDIGEELGSIAEGGRRDLTVAVTTYVAIRWLSPRLNRFLGQHPDVSLRLQHPPPGRELVIDEVPDLAIWVGNGRWPGTTAEPLLPSRITIVCSPTVLDNVGSLDSPSDLKKHTVIHASEKQVYWKAWCAIAGIEGLVPAAHAYIADPNVRVQAAIDGHGVILADDLIREEIENGRLIAPFDGVIFQAHNYCLIRPRTRSPSSLALAFRDWLVDEARRAAAL